jgi:hypothetical protein
LLSGVHSFLLLTSNHLLHGFILKFLGPFLHGDHFLMLNLFLFETLRFIHGTVLDRTLVVADSLLLLHTSLVESLTLHLLLVSLLLAVVIFVGGLDDVALTDFQDVLSLLLSLLNFLPRLLKTIK